jgi:transketolase
MRNAFVETLCELAEYNDRIWLLTADLGFSVLEPFIKRFPERYINVGVAEQNMTGIEAGLALSGKIVFAYSIANFPVMRCLEQVRNDICYHNADVKIVTVGGGYVYGAAGYTHHGVEDLAVMLVLPNMTVIAPGDPLETRMATRAIADHPGPCFLRLAKAGEPILHKTEPDFQIGKAIMLREGQDITLVSTGGILELVLGSSEKLTSLGYSAEVISMPTLSPLDQDAIVRTAQKTGKIITIEEHGPGGLGSLVAEVVAQMDVPIKFKPVRLRREHMFLAGSQDRLRSYHGLSVDGIVEAALGILRRT